MVRKRLCRREIVQSFNISSLVEVPLYIMELGAINADNDVMRGGIACITNPLVGLSDVLRFDWSYKHYSTWKVSVTVTN
jgi:hypothetical protein